MHFAPLDGSLITFKETDRARRMIEIKPGSGMFLRAEKTILGEITDMKKLRVSLEKKSLLEMLDLRR